MEKVRQKLSGLVFGIGDACHPRVGRKKCVGLTHHQGHCNIGFTLLEILIALLIVGLMGAIIIPNLTGRTARYEREAFISELNRITQFAWQQSIMTNKMHRVLFNFEQNNIVVEKQLNDATEKKEVFGPITGAYVESDMKIPAQLRMKQFFVEGQDELGRFVGRATKDAWFYIFSDGTTQQVTINMVDIKDKKNNKPRPVGLVLNPFTAQFAVYDEYKST